MASHGANPSFPDRHGHRRYCEKLLDLRSRCTGFVQSSNLPGFINLSFNFTIVHANDYAVRVSFDLNESIRIRVYRTCNKLSTFVTDMPQLTKKIYEKLTKPNPKASNFLLIKCA